MKGILDFLVYLVSLEFRVNLESLVSREILGFLDKSMLGIQWVVFDKPVFGLDILEFLVGLVILVFLVFQENLKFLDMAMAFGKMDLIILVDLEDLVFLEILVFRGNQMILVYSMMVSLIQVYLVILVNLVCLVCLVNQVCPDNLEIQKIPMVHLGSLEIQGILVTLVSLVSLVRLESLVNLDSH